MNLHLKRNVCDQKPRNRDYFNYPNNFRQLGQKRKRASEQLDLEDELRYAEVLDVLDEPPSEAEKDASVQLVPVEVEEGGRRATKYLVLGAFA